MRPGLPRLADGPQPSTHEAVVDPLPVVHFAFVTNGHFPQMIGGVQPPVLHFFAAAFIRVTAFVLSGLMYVSQGQPSAESTLLEH